MAAAAVAKAGGNGLLNLSNLAPNRSIAELLAEPVRYVPAKHTAEPTLPPGLEPVNVPASASQSRQQQQQQQQQQLQSQPQEGPASLEASTSRIQKSEAGPVADADDVGQPVAASGERKKNGLVANWPTGISGAAHGLINNGNTCYLNATLQGLIHLPAMISILPRLHNTHTCERKGVCSLCKLLALVQGAFKGHSRAVMPAGILGLLKKIAPHFRRFAQEDAHEFLRLLLDSCVEADVTPKQLKQNPKLKDTSSIHRLFGGRFCSRVHCRSCGYNSDTYDTFLDVSLQLTRKTGSLEDCFDVFTQPDQLTGANRYRCEKCKGLVNATKSLSINKAPFILTAHIKRFSPLRQKLSVPITYPETLDLEPWMTDSGQHIRYRLDGVICHSGSSANSGHYYSYVRTSNGDWYRQDDSSSSKLSRGERAGVFNLRQAYVLLYSREDRELPSSPAFDAVPNESGQKQPQQPSSNAGQSHSSSHLGKRKQPFDSEHESPRPTGNRPRTLSDVGPSSAHRKHLAESVVSRPQSSQGHYSRPKSPYASAFTSARNSADQHRRMSMPSSMGRPKVLDGRPPAPASVVFGNRHKHQKHNYGGRNKGHWR